jgi:hypothetical protein
MPSVWIVFRQTPLALGRQVVAVYADEDKDAAVGVAAASVWLVAERWTLTDPAEEAAPDGR